MKKSEKGKILVKVLLLLLAAVCVAVPLLSPLTYGDEITNTKNNLNNTQSNIKSTEKALKQGEQKSKQLQSEIKSLEGQIYKTSAEINTLTKQLNETKQKVTDVLAELDAMQQKLDTQNAALMERLRVMYKNGDAGMISVLLGSSSMTELLTNVELMKRVYQSDADLIEDLGAQYDEIEAKKEELVGLKEVLESQQTSLQNKKSSQQADMNSLSKLKTSVDKNNDILEAQIDALNKEADALKAKILKLQSTAKYKGGTMCWPSKASSRITSPFGNRMHPILKKMKLHTGIDIGAPKGTAILAANSGTVITAAYNNSYGYYVMIDHGGGIVTVYAHSSKLLVSKGAKVKKGQTIALVGSTGMSTGAHLHFEVRINGVYKNPLDYVTPGRYYYD